MTDNNRSELALLAQYGACDVADALDKLGHAAGYLHTPQLLVPPPGTGATKAVGFAYTVEIVAHDDASAPTYTGNYVDACPAGAVMVVSVPPAAHNAVFGGLLATRASVVGAAGFVSNGRVRDIDEIHDAKVPAFVGGVSILSAQKRTRVARTNEPVTIDGVTVNSGDVIVADANGVAVVPHALVGAVADMCAKLVVIDDKVKVDVLAGASLVEGFKKWRG
ncbi:hypothetical protein H9P43_001551 [Blastocladiella emersonii ATCC 22665]|nr:hypothetical protein H9P43_001551 [Blastocladiella emersonii ATCC 22665]